jgi:hypothetical protein
MSPRKKHTQPAKSGNPEAEVLKHRNPTVVTPLVSNIAVMFFKHTLRVAGQLDSDDADDDATGDFDNFIHHDDPESIVWMEPAEVKGYYESVDMDGKRYSVRLWPFHLHRSKNSVCERLVMWPWSCLAKMSIKNGPQMPSQRHLDPKIPSGIPCGAPICKFMSFFDGTPM